MEGDQHQYELRSRSRSRSQTPLVLGRPIVELELLDHHYELRSKSRERSHTPGEVTSSRRSGSRSLPGSTVKAQDNNMETITEAKDETTAKLLADNQNKHNESSTGKKTERRSERQKAKRQIFANGQSEVKEDISEHKSEQKKKHKTQNSKIFTSDYSSEEGEREDPPSRPGSAYEIYKNAGDWWNVFPKTDYTYSLASQCRYEIAPGVLAMPNMSRRSIHSDGSSTVSSVPSLSQQNLSQSSQGTESGIGDITDTIESKELYGHPNDIMALHSRHSDSVARSMLYKTTHVEQYSSHREVLYMDDKTPQDLQDRHFSLRNAFTSTALSHAYNNTTQAESDTELDDALLSTIHKQDESWKIVRWFYTFTSMIGSFFNRILELVHLKSVEKRRYYSSYSYQRYRVTESRWSKLWNYIGRSMNYIYFLLIRVMVLDTWLLSQFSSMRRRMQEKGPLILWMVLLPLLLTAGAYIAQKHSLSCLDSLRNVQYGVTETTYRIFNDISNLTSFEYDFFMKHIAKLQNYSLPTLSSVNESLPEILKIGWNITW